MTDYKEKYQKAIKALDESEIEASDGVKLLYKTLLGVLDAVKGQHGLIDRAITNLPNKVSIDSLPIVDLDRLRDLLVSHMGEAGGLDSTSQVLETMLSELGCSEELKDEMAHLQRKLDKAGDAKGYISIAHKLARVILAGKQDQRALGDSNQSIDEIKEGLFHQLELLEQSDSELAQSLDLGVLKERLAKVVKLSDLEAFYTYVFEGLGKRLSKKDGFIVELSGLIETVIQQLAGLSLDIARESITEERGLKDRWRITELMSEQVNAIRESVVRAESLTTLKDILTDRIGELNNNVKQLVEMEGDRARKAEERAKDASVKLKIVEEEVGLLKVSLNKAHEQAFVDSLTGVANRRAYDQRIKVEFDRWKRSQGGLVVAILDIDHFKKINDDHGHLIGDKVLRKISQLIDKQVRESDFFGRIGGEEFAVIFVDSDIEHALVRLNEFRESVFNCKFGLQGRRIVITMSAGCAKFSINDRPDVVFERADRALYQAKDAGRNKCLSELDLSD
ncbi:MAG: GGDEF domain-containing protein [Piscirickettsiaceae bacterium]|nr:MAG: GGDEF domain-containing protein [Piscirickettsiaceae bacterium]